MSLYDLPLYQAVHALSHLAQGIALAALNVAQAYLLWRLAELAWAAVRVLRQLDGARLWPVLRLRQVLTLEPRPGEKPVEVHTSIGPTGGAAVRPEERG